MQSNRAASARENARRGDGKFGTYSLDEGDVDLDFLDQGSSGDGFGGFGGFGVEEVEVETPVPPVPVVGDAPHFRGTEAATDRPNTRSSDMSTEQSEKIQRAIRRYEGAASVSEIAKMTGSTPTRTRTQVKKMLASGELVELGVNSHGSQCYGPAPEGHVAPAPSPSKPAKQLKVWSITSGITGDAMQQELGMPDHARQARYTVAATSRVAAVRAFNAAGLRVTNGYMKNYGSETGNETEVERANGKQGTVFATQDNSRDLEAFVELSPAEQDTPEPKRPKLLTHVGAQDIHNTTSDYLLLKIYKGEKVRVRSGGGSRVEFADHTGEQYGTEIDVPPGATVTVL